MRNQPSPVLGLLSAIAIAACQGAPGPDAPTTSAPSVVELVAEPADSAAPIALPATPDPAPPSAAPSARPGPLPGCLAPGKAVREALDVTRALAERSPAPPRRQHAAIESVRLRLRELLGDRCAARATGRELTATLFPAAEIPALPTPLEGVHVWPVDGHPGLWLASAHDHGSWVALYRREAAMVRTLIAVTDRGTAMEDQLMLFDVAVLQPPGAPEPMLAVAASHPWMSSCWRGLRFLVLGAGPSQQAPKTLYAKTTGGRVCEDVTVKVEGEGLRFDYLTWPLRLREPFPRSAALSLRYANGRFEEHYGHVGGPINAVDSWISLPWSVAAEITLPASASRLEAAHERITRATPPSESIYSAELFPGESGGRRVVVYCSRDGKERCPEWPKPVDFKVVFHGGHWLVAEVSPR